MAKHNHVDAWRPGHLNAVERRQAQVISRSSKAMEDVMAEAVDSILFYAEKTGMWHQPDLSGMFGVSELFYRLVIATALECSTQARGFQKGDQKKLARLPSGLPRKLKDIEQVFRDRRYWPKVMKRSRILTQKLRVQYLNKLERKFNQIMPKIRAGELSPAQAKEQMMDTWKASKSRVETIFRTETTNYFGRAQVNYFAGDPEIIGFLFDSVRDSSRTKICKDRHGLVYRPGTKALILNTPACHYNCRSHLIPLANTPENRKLLEDPQRDPSKRSVAPLPKGWRK